MKTLKVLTILLASMFILNACKDSGVANTPEDVAEKFLNLLEEQKYDQAKKLGTKNTVEFVEFIESVASMGQGMMGDTEITPSEIKDLECDVDGDKATCTYTKDGEKDKVNLIKEDGKWLVDMKKEMM